MITSENLHAHEIIGLDAKVELSGNTMSGRVINETKNTIILQTKQGVKQIPKNVSVWKFSLYGTRHEIDGTALAGRPHDRLLHRRRYD